MGNIKGIRGPWLIRSRLDEIVTTTSTYDLPARVSSGSCTLIKTSSDSQHVSSSSTLVLILKVSPTSNSLD